MDRDSRPTDPIEPVAPVRSRTTTARSKAKVTIKLADSEAAAQFFEGIAALIRAQARRRGADDEPEVSVTVEGV